MPASDTKIKDVTSASELLHDLEGAPGLVSVRVLKYPPAETARFYNATHVSNAFAPSPGVSDWH